MAPSSPPLYYFKSELVYKWPKPLSHHGKQNHCFVVLLQPHNLNKEESASTSERRKETANPEKNLTRKLQNPLGLS